MSSNRNFSQGEAERRSSYEHSSPKDSNFNPKASSWDYFKAGAKDFIQDVKGVLSSTSKGPSFENRSKLK